MTWLELGSMFAALMVGHSLADFPLQGDFLSKAKNHADPIPGVPWWQAMLSHCIIHGGFVGGIIYLFAGSLPLALMLGLAEAVIHFEIDTAKCAGKFTFGEDQVRHWLCKLGWTVWVLLLG